MSRNQVLIAALLSDIVLLGVFFLGQDPVQRLWGEEGAVWLAAALAVAFILINVALLWALSRRRP